jgi:hypothetical protein
MLSMDKEIERIILPIDGSDYAKKAAKKTPPVSVTIV